MSDIQRYLLDYDRNRRDASATAQQSAAREDCPPCTFLPSEILILDLGLQSGDLRLLKLIEELGEYFNSEDGAVRSKSECPEYGCELGAWD
jgi:DNA repair/transcription protein MET18/MMS19